MQLITPRLLITDDDRDFRETVACALAARGFETLQAADGEEALQIVGRLPVHLLLLDMHMPRLTGLELIERLHEWAEHGRWTLPTDENVTWAPLADEHGGWAPPAGEHVGSNPRVQLTPGRQQIERIPTRLRVPPWILISASLDEQLVASARAASAFSVLFKPVRLPDLTGAVLGALAQAYDWHAE